MEKKGHHVVRSLSGGWAVRQSGSSRVSKTFKTQAEAVAYARDRARSEHGELYVHRSDGTISGRDSYGSDPYPPKDKR